MNYIQDTMLNFARKKKIPLQIFLVNGFQLKGTLVAFDSFVIVLMTGGKQQQMVYKHAISTIIPQDTIPIEMKE